MAKTCSSHDVRRRAAQDVASSREGQRSAVLRVRQYGFRGTVQQYGLERHLRTQVPRRQKDLHGKTWFTLQRQPRFSQQVVEHSPPSLKTSDHRSNRGKAKDNFPPSFFFVSYKTCSWLDSHSKRHTSVAPEIVRTKAKQILMFCWPCISV